MHDKTVTIDLPGGIRITCAPEQVSDILRQHQQATPAPSFAPIGVAPPPSFFPMGRPFEVTSVAVARGAIAEEVADLVRQQGQGLRTRTA